jgi:hypothetical protein
MSSNFVMESYGGQIRMIIAEHKQCGGHCHNFGEPNDLTSVELPEAHVATIITYYTKGYFDGLL